MKFLLQTLTLVFALNFYSCGQSTKIDTNNQDKQLSDNFAPKKFTKEKIDSTSDDELIQVVFDKISSKMTADNDEYEAVLSLPKPQQSIYIIWVLEAEVNNGGFNQYYYNTNNQFSQLLLGALKQVGANKFALLVEKANKVYFTNQKSITKTQDGSVDGFSESYKGNPLEKFDFEFYDLYKKEDLQKLQVKFIRRNVQYFID